MYTHSVSHGPSFQSISRALYTEWTFIPQLLKYTSLSTHACIGYSLTNERCPLENSTFILKRTPMNT